MSAVEDTRSLRRLMFAGFKALGIDDEARHDLSERVTGRRSTSGMSKADLRLIVSELRDKGFDPEAPRAHKPAPRADLRYVHVLWRLLGEADVLTHPGRDGLNIFIRKRFGDSWGATAMDVDVLTDHRQINDLIRALQAWCHREGIPTER